MLRPTAPLLAALLLAVPPSLAATARKPVTHTVHVREMKFVPAQLTVHVGDTVVWRNDDLVPHNVVAGGGGPGAAFASDPLQAGATFRWVAREKGAFPYVCTLHPGMSGTLTVR